MGHELAEAPVADEALLEHVQEADDAEHGGGDVARVHEEGEDLGQGGGVAGDHPCAEGDVEERVAFEQELGAGEEGGVEGGDALEGLAEAGVGAAEGLPGAAFAGETLDLADALDGVFDVRGEGGGLVAVRAPHLVDPALEAAGEEEDEGNGQEGPGGEGRVDPEHEGKGAHEREGDFQEGLWQEVRGRADHAQVGGQAAEHLAGLGVVEIGEREALEVVEEIPAQGGLDAEAQPLAADGAAPFREGGQDGQRGEGERREPRRPQITRGEIDLEDAQGHRRDRQAQPRLQHQRREVKRQKRLVRAVMPSDLANPLFDLAR